MSPLEIYFAGERNAGILAAALGVVSLAFAFWLWRGGTPFRAMLFPIGLVGLGQLGVGIGLVAKTPPQVARLETALAADPPAARAVETRRMERVARNFTVIEIVEAVALVAGAAMALFLRARPAAVGVGMGLAIQAAVMLAFDVFAEKRAEIYLAWLR